MSDRQKREVLAEARMQVKALHKLGIWKRAMLSLAVIGMILVSTGAGADGSLLREVFGFCVVAFAGGAALLVHIGQRNGKRNVEKMLRAVEG